MPPRTSELRRSRARRLRRDQTIAEDILWRALRNRQLGVKFRRQVPIGAFIADFACVEARLVVEVDGPSHESEAGAAHDAWRDRCLGDMGWRIVRVPNALAIGGGDLVLAPVRAALDHARSEETVERSGKASRSLGSAGSRISASLRPG